MSIKVEETQESRSLSEGYEANQNSIDLEFVAWDDATPEPNCDPVAIRAAVLATVLAGPYGDPLYGLRLQTIQLKAVTKSIFIATAHYGVTEPPKIDQLRFGFSTAGGQETITHSLATIARYAATFWQPKPAPDFGNAILVTKDGVQGTKRGVGQLAFRVTGYFDPNAWDASQWLNLAELSHTWNIALWHGWPAKYLLFEHAECGDYELETGKLVPVTFHFKCKRPESVNKGNGIAFTKDPWDHVWDDVIPYADSASSAKATKIRSTHREQIYAGSDFTLLGLG